MITNVYNGIPGKLMNLEHAFNPQGRIPPIRQNKIQDYIQNNLIAYACSLASKVNTLREEYDGLSNHVKSLSHRRNKALNERGLTDIQKRHLEEISRDWPNDLRGLTEMYEILSNVTVGYTYKRSTKDPDPIYTYVSLFKLVKNKDDLTNFLKRPDDFIDFLITCVWLVRHDINSTKREINDFKNKKNNQQKSFPYPSSDEQ